MRINYKTIKKILVETKNGTKLGRIFNFILETEGQSVVQYEVGSMIGKKYLIGCNQVISIDEKKMVVEDGVIKIENEIETKTNGRIDVEPVAMRNESL